MQLTEVFGLTEAAHGNPNRALLDYFRFRPIEIDDEFRHELWSHYVQTELDDPEITYYDLDPQGQRQFADWLEREGHVREFVYRDPQTAPAWMLLAPINDRLLPSTTWLAHFCRDAAAIRQQGFVRGVPDVDRLALTRINSVFGTSERIRYNQPGYNFAYPTDGSVPLTQRWGDPPNGYGRQVLLFQSSGLLVYHEGDREDQVIFWGPAANMTTARVIKATRYGFVADDGTRNKTLDGFDRAGTA